MKRYLILLLLFFNNIVLSQDSKNLSINLVDKIDIGSTFEITDNQVGSIIKKPIVKEDKVVVGHTMKLTLACDHRTVDGVTGSLFLETLKGFVENPFTMLV